MAAEGARMDVDVAKLRSDLDQLRNDIAKLGDTVKTVVVDGGYAAYARVRRSAEKYQKQAKDVVDMAAEEIEEHPVATVLSAFGIGLLMGLLFSRRS